MSFVCVVEHSPERLILCGGVAASGGNAGRALKLDVDAPPSSDARINLKIDHLTKEMVADVPRRLVDLLQIACYIFCADQFTSRGPRSMQAMGAKWRRRFRFVVPVAEPDFWNGTDIRDSLVDLLTFLSDDYYEFDFAPKSRDLPSLHTSTFRRTGPPTGFNPDSIILFSGGLDSLTGAAEALNLGKRVALVSHRSSPMVQSRQRALPQGTEGKKPIAAPLQYRRLSQQGPTRGQGLLPALSVLLLWSARVRGCTDVREGRAEFFRERCCQPQPGCL